MLGKLFGIFCLVSLAFALPTGNIEAVGDAVLDGASSAVSLSLSLCGTLCLWCGILQVFSEAGVTRMLSERLKPVFRIFFPNAAKTGEGLEEICASVSANLLGIGNAATPMALRAMEKLQHCNPDPESASDEQITLAVLNTSAATFLPANLLALRRAAGSAKPYAILVPVWITSLLCASTALVLTSLPRLFSRRRPEPSRKPRASKFRLNKGSRGRSNHV